MPEEQERPEGFTAEVPAVEEEARAAVNEATAQIQAVRGVRLDCLMVPAEGILEIVRVIQTATVPIYLAPGDPLKHKRALMEIVLDALVGALPEDMRRPPEPAEPHSH